jgi:hypothetical protein
MLLVITWSLFGKNGIREAHVACLPEGSRQVVGRKLPKVNQF